ncbi:acid protease [Daldinia decipiens]|uniref:acid protease n=1 Tax=Daldinia decipiens TaxID=326647 RepID=UPI0020C23CC9|nr:acid protease [Daldinia decipiens]KAI1659230.1 acid protease [Daldinia decipiens]
MHQSKLSLQLLLWSTALVQGLPTDEKSNSHDSLENREAPNNIGFVTFNSKAHGNLKRDAPSDSNPQLGFVTFKMSSKQTVSRDSHTDKLSRVTQSLAAKYGSNVPTRSTSEDPALRNRDNNYHVDPAVKPSVSNAAGIDQDGTDYSYFLEAAFGSEGKKMYMLVDTGASTTWVMGSGCVTTACAKHNTYGPNDSKTYKDTEEGYSVEYGSGAVSGHVVSDSISIAGLEVTMPFGVANITSDQFSQFPFEGILGLSMVDGTWLTHLKDAKLIDANVFGIALNRKADGTNDGEVAFGAPNKAKYTGDISYTGLQSEDSWAIPMDDVLFGGNSAGVKGRLAYIDTGTTFVFGPPADVAALYKLIPGSKTIDNGKTYTVPCDTDGEVAFSFSGKAYTASSRDFITAPNTGGTCFGSVYGFEFIPGAWLVGDMFLKNVYSVFDMDQKRIGFAARAASSSSTSSSATPSGTSTTSPSGSSTLGSATATATSDGSSPTGSPSVGSGVGLVPEGTAAAGSGTSSSPTESAPGSTPTTDSSGVRLSAVGVYTSLMCILLMGMIL